MLKRRGIWIVVLVLVIAGGVILGKKKSSDTAQTAAKVPVTTAPQMLEFLPSDIAVAQQGDVSKLLSLSGALRAFNQATVKAKVAGDVREVLVREGEAVQQGQVVVRMDTGDFEARLAQARGALAAAQGQLEIARLARDNNKALLDKNFISKNAFDNGNNQYEIALANVDSAKGAVSVAQKALADTSIHAPITGLISSRTVQPGEKVAVDIRLLDVVDLRTMEMEAPVPTQDIANIKIGQQVQLVIEGVADKVNGKVTRINPATAAGSRSIMAYIQIANPEGILRAGMFGEMQLVVDKKSGVLLIPQTAIQQDTTQSSVYVIENNLIQQKTVQLGLKGDSNGVPVVEVLSGLAKDSKVIKTNLGSLRSGLPARVAPVTGKV
ncbi:efflux RND transporter periplasmic adaptor subunit [Undibacterium sp. SXout7W]|uniref:efflux RND transporter periplasmic adaptor subunit n=1 Tax=Undibacterium sp. SXout7W TaxID=3413049 RepID=UPI003BF3934F